MTHKKITQCRHCSHTVSKLKVNLLNTTFTYLSSQLSLLSVFCNILLMLYKTEYCGELLHLFKNKRCSDNCAATDLCTYSYRIHVSSLISY